MIYSILRNWMESLVAAPRMMFVTTTMVSPFLIKLLFLRISKAFSRVFSGSGSIFINIG